MNTLPLSLNTAQFKVPIHPRTFTVPYFRRQPLPMISLKSLPHKGIQAYPWKPIEKSIESLRNGMSIEGLVHYNGDVGGGYGANGMWDGKVTFATLGIISVCIYLARAQIKAVAKDFVQYVFTGKQSAHFKRVMVALFKKFLQLEQ